MSLPTLPAPAPLLWPHELELRGCIVAPWEIPPGDAVHTDGGRTHGLIRVREWENPHAAFFVDWEARCGARGTFSGSLTLGTSAIDQAHRMVRAMACRGCWSLPRGGRPVASGGTRCAGCGHDPACGYATVTDGGTGRVDRLCHADDHSCYSRRVGRS